MAGNSQRRGAVRKTGYEEGRHRRLRRPVPTRVAGQGSDAAGGGSQGPSGRPQGECRVARDGGGRSGGSGGNGGSRGAAATKVTGGRGTRRTKDLPETVVGRNPVVEALRAGVPATALYVAQGMPADDRVTEAVQIAGGRGIALLEISRPELDRLTGNAIHQGLALAVPPYKYAQPRGSAGDRAKESGEPALLVAVDGVTDPRNLGAIVRSAAAFGAHGVVVPERRSAGMTASAWRTSAGTAARIRVARCTNLVRTLKD